MKFFFTQRADLPTLASEFELSPAQCHVLHLIEPDRPIPMGRLAEALACDASNVTGLVDRLESRGPRPAAGVGRETGGLKCWNSLRRERASVPSSWNG